MSLDGYVAGPNGELNWAKVDEELFDYVGNRIKNSDTALYGRVTFQMMESYWPNAGYSPTATKHEIEHSKWYAQVHKVVLSKTLKLPNSNSIGLAKTTIISDHLVDKINELKQQKGDEVLIFGSPEATHSLMKLNLIDGYWLFVNPIILGDGIPLFIELKDKINLKLLGSKQFSNGVTELNYEVERQSLALP
jgi:dihydrofolate reductase